MPTPGYYFRDGGTTPADEIDNPANTEFRQRITKGAKPVTATRKAPLGQETSTSHILATQNHAIQGAAQQAGKIDGITNLGWQKNAKGVDTLVGGLDNDDLWMLIRRFNKVSLTWVWRMSRLITCSKPSMSRRYLKLLREVLTLTLLMRRNSLLSSSVPTSRDCT